LTSSDVLNVILGAVLDGDLSRHQRVQPIGYLAPGRL